MSDQKQTMELTTKPERNVASALKIKGPEILAVAAQNVRQDEHWLLRAQMEVMAKPETAALMTTQTGVDSFIRGTIKAATVGISFGSVRPEAYFVPDGKGGVRLDVSQFGYAHAAVYGPGQILKQVPELIIRHENDGIRMDQGIGKILFPAEPYDPLVDMGRQTGWMIQLDFSDGRKSQVEWITFEAVKHIADTYGNQQGPAYKKSQDKMYNKIAMKQMLDRVFAEAERKSKVPVDFDEPPFVDTEPQTPAARMEQKMEKAASKLKPAETVASEPEAQTVDEEPAESGAETTEAPKEEKKNPEDIF